MTTAQPLSPSRPAVAPGVLPRAPRAALIYAAYALTVCALFWPTLSVMAQKWFASSAYHHGVLVAPIAIWMIARKGLGESAKPSLLATSGVLAAAIIWLLGRAASVNLVEQFGFVSLLIAGAAVVLGVSGFRRLAFPLLFLYFMVPIGSVVTPVLQQVTADSAVTLLNLSGIRAAIDGFLITTSAGKYEIAEACAGLNFLLAALMVAAIYSWFAFSSRWKIAAFFAFAVAFAVIANIARAYVVILAATLTDGTYSIGADHIVFGWVFYGLLLFALVAVGRRFADVRPMNARQYHKATSGKLTARGAVAIAAALTINIAAAGYGYAIMERASPITLPSELPLLNAPGWRVSAPFPSWRASVDDADRSLHVSYQKDTSAVQLAAGYFAYDRRGVEIGGQVTASVDASAWRRIGARTVSAQALGTRREISVTTLEDRWGQRLDVVTLYWLDNQLVTDETTLKFRVAVERLKGNRSRGGVFYVAAIADKGGSLSRPLAQFLGSAEPLSAWLARIDAKPTN